MIISNREFFSIVNIEVNVNGQRSFIINKILFLLYSKSIIINKQLRNEVLENLNNICYAKQIRLNIYQIQRCINN